MISTQSAFVYLANRARAMFETKEISRGDLESVFDRIKVLRVGSIS